MYEKKFNNNAERNQNLCKPVVLFERATGKMFRFKSLTDVKDQLGYNPLTIRSFIAGRKTKINKYWMTEQDVAQMLKGENK